VKKLRLGVIGIGSVVREIYDHLYYRSRYSPFIEIAAICGRNPESVRKYGDLHNIPSERRFTDYRQLIANVPLDAVAINTPDHFHMGPAVYAMEAGLDVLMAKPTADNVKDAHALIEKSKESGRFIGVDFHKREDPRIREAKTRFQQGRYGTFQSSVWYMLDKLMVADPNHIPRFFNSPDFAEKNSPVSFLTVHMADAFMSITGLKPMIVKATGYKQKLPSLEPLSVDGYDLADTEIIFENGGICHIITGWAIPNTAHAVTVQSGRIIGTEGILDLNLDQPGYHEIITDGIFERNPLFRNFEPDGSVSGYGISSPGKIIENIIRFRNNEMNDREKQELMNPFASGFYTSLICQGAHVSLESGNTSNNGVVSGRTVQLQELLKKEIGESACRNYYK
jgi:predicted dehydrogenase